MIYWDLGERERNKEEERRREFPQSQGVVSIYKRNLRTRETGGSIVPLVVSPITPTAVA